MEGGDVGSLANRVTEESSGNAGAKGFLFDFVFDGRIALQSGDGNEIEVKHSQLCKFRNERLNENSCKVGIYADSKIVEGNFEDVSTDFVGIGCVIS